MKVNMDQMPDNDQAVKKSKTASSGLIKPKEKTIKSDSPSGEGIYKKALAEYAEKMKGGQLLRKNKFWIVVCVVLFLIFISTNSRMSNQKTHLTMNLNAITKETNDLTEVTEEHKEDLEEQARIESVKLTQEEEELARNNAVEQGVLVADKQNAYSNIQPPESISEGTDEEQRAAYQAAMDAYVQSIKDNAAALDPFFGPDEKNGRTPWYNYQEPIGISGTWEFASKASFKGTSAQVLWLCYSNDDHTLLAFCTGKYDAETKVFTELDCKLTQYATSHMTTEDSETASEAETEQIKSISEKLKELANDPEMQVDGPTDEEKSEMTETRESFYEDVKNGEVEGEEFDSRYEPGFGGGE